MVNINVLSLFDGISCGQIALERVGIKVDNYYASEIDKNAIRVTQYHYPKTIQLGDVTKWKDWNIDWKSIDLLIGGSPCQGFSFAGKQLNFNDPRSKLFFTYVDILNHLKKENPNIKFLLENVNMKEEFINTISEYMKVEPIKLNSALVSAQNRVRLYWKNFEHDEILDKNINLSDILEYDNESFPAAIRGRKLNKAVILGRRLNENGHREDYNKDVSITQCLEVRKTNTNKSNCITTVGKDNVLTTLPSGRYPNAFKDKLPFRYYTKKELCRLQTLSDDYLDIVSDSMALKLIGNSWTVDMIKELLKKLK
jgi:DNA (cytosine-5)-methyltransferase 3A